MDLDTTKARIDDRRIEPTVFPYCSVNCPGDKIFSLLFAAYDLNKRTAPTKQMSRIVEARRNLIKAGEKIC